MEDITKKGDPRAIIAAIVALLNTLSVVLGIDMGNVIAQIERMVEEREDRESSSFASESEQSDVAGTTAPGQKRHRRQHRGKPGKHPRAVVLELTNPEPAVTSLPGGTGICLPDQFPMLPPPAPVAAKANVKPAVERQRPALAHEVRAAENKIRIPPIVLRTKEMWSALLTILRQRGIALKEAKYQTLGVRIIPKGIDEYRKLVAILDEKRWEYHTYQLPEEKTLRVVVRGIPEGVTEDDVKEDLESQGFHPTKVTRMTKRGGDKTPLPLMMVQLPREEKRIFDVKTAVHLRVRVESLKSKASEGQCYNCQKFGHAQNRCRAAPMCVKCGGQHSSRDCGLERTKPATCGNCQGSHPASYGACPANPRMKKPARPVQSGNSYASMAKRSGAIPTTKVNRPAQPPTKINRPVQRINQAAASEESTSMAAVMQDAFWANMERVMLDMQRGMLQLAEQMRRAQQGRGH